MTTKKLNAALLAFVAVASFATATSSPAAAKGRFEGGHGPVRNGLHDPFHGPGSSHNPTSGLHRTHLGGPGRGFPYIPFPIGPSKPTPKRPGPDRNWGGGGGYGMGRGGEGRGYRMGRGFGGGIAADTAYVVTLCGKHLHWSPHYQRCIPNYS